MDRYLLARIRRLVERVEKSLNEFAISDACDAVSDFIDVLTNWYIRNTRDRFWNEDANAFNTLYTVLEAFMRVLAPLAPMEAESVWRGLTGGESVHLADWPFVVDEKTGEDTELGRVLVDDPALVDAMEKVREVVSGTLSLRKAAKIRVRQPLSKLTVVVENVDAVKAYDELLKSELNIKNIEFSTLEDAAAHGLKIVHELRVNARAAGPRLGKQVQFAIKASKSGDWHVDAASGAPVVSTPSGDLELVEGEYELINRVEEENATEAAASVSAALPTGGFVILGTALDADLLAEGYARDAIRAIQDARKDADLDIADRISLVLTVPADDGFMSAAVSCAEKRFVPVSTDNVGVSPSFTRSVHSLIPCTSGVRSMRLSVAAAVAAAIFSSSVLLSICTASAISEVNSVIAISITGSCP